MNIQDFFPCTFIFATSARQEGKQRKWVRTTFIWRIPARQKKVEGRFFMTDQFHPNRQMYHDMALSFFVSLPVGSDMNPNFFSLALSFSESLPVGEGMRTNFLRNFWNCHFISRTFAPHEEVEGQILTNFAATDGWIPHEGPNSDGVIADHFQNKNICPSSRGRGTHIDQFPPFGGM